MFAKRREKLRRKLREENLAGLLVSLPANRYYLSGFELHDVQQNESAGHLLVTADGPDILCTDARYKDAAARIWPEADIFIYAGSGMADLNRFLRGRFRAGRVLGFEASLMPVRFYEGLREGLAMRPADGLVEKMREIKDADELARIAESMALNQRLMEWVPGVLLPGRTEAEIAWDIERFFRENGASENAFPPIVAVGKNGALPHAEPGDSKISGNCPVLIDCGARFKTYNSDQTRTFWVGDAPTGVFRQTLDLVREAQAAAIAAIRPGVACSAIHAKAAEVFERAGQAQFFTHSLGHGLGLETHEAPRFSPRDKTILAPGMVITVEPGLYYPEWGGVRWENVIAVTEDGARVF